MNEVLLELILPFFDKPLIFTGWKIVGWTGALLFASRWFVQAWVSRQRGQSVMPLTFWLMSVAGSALTLIYFTLGKNDSVGILQNLSPFLLALYNVWLMTSKKSPTRGDAEEA